MAYKIKSKNDWNTNLNIIIMLSGLILLVVFITILAIMISGPVYFFGLIAIGVVAFISTVYANDHW